MHPVLFKLFWMGKEVVIGTYGVTMVIALAAGTALSLYIARKRGHPSPDFINYCMLVIAGIIGGALLAGYLVFLPERAGKGFIDYPTAWVSWGGIMGGLAALLYIKYKWKECFLAIADIITPGCMLGLGIGRIGCFFAGCCYGISTTSCIGVTFTDPMAPAAAMPQPLVPTQLISAAFLVCAGLAFIPAALRETRSGLVFGASAVAYSVFRFTIEFWRDDPRLFLFGLSDGQLFSAAYLLLGLAVMGYAFRRKEPSR